MAASVTGMTGGMRIFPRFRGLLRCRVANQGLQYRSYRKFPWKTIVSPQGVTLPRIYNDIKFGGTVIEEGEVIEVNKPDKFGRVLEQKCIVLTKEEPEPPPSSGVYIGLAFKKPKVGKAVRVRTVVENRTNPELEKSSRSLTLKVPLDRVRGEWLKSEGVSHLRNIIRHYNIFQDLFDGAEFMPVVHLQVHYPGRDGGDTGPVLWGNDLLPEEAALPPKIQYETDPNTLWTLLLTNPDGHLLRPGEVEYVHWLIGNIPGADLEQGDTLYQYLPPFPPRGTGYHRHVFVLFKQDQKIDFSDSVEKQALPHISLEERTFRTVDFYRKHQKHMTPAGLGFFQSRWDRSVTDTYRQTLRMREPVYEYDRPKQPIAQQKKWPANQPLKYLKKYADYQKPFSEVHSGH